MTRANRVRAAVATASGIPISQIHEDDDFAEDLGLNHLELLSLALIVEEIFSIVCPDNLFETVRYRTAAALAEWVDGEVRKAAWAQLERERKRA